jgi:protease-4
MTGRRATSGRTSARREAGRAVVAAGLMLSLAVLGAAGCDGGARPGGAGSATGPARELREIVLETAPTDSPGGSLFEAPAPTLREVLGVLDAARKDEASAGVFLRVGALGAAWARLRDVAGALAAVRAAGKPVHCHFDAVDNAAYALLARSCDRISMTPAGDLGLVGVAAQLFYARRLLDSVGVQADILHMGRYKNAAEPLERDAMSPETRESTGALLDDLHTSLLAAVAEGRRMTPEQAQAAIDAGPHDADAARRLGLVDAIAFDDEARAKAKEAARATRVVPTPLRAAEAKLDFSELVKALSGEQRTARTTRGARLALVVLDGEITDGERASGTGSGTSGPFVRHLRALADDAEVKAVVLRIDSPGGSALASDRMWHAVRRVAGRKPVIVSLGDVAASGGYYVACAGTEILAQEESIVGSIGVLGGKLSMGGLAERIGVSSEILARGQNAAWGAPTRPFTESERQAVDRMLRSTYERFLDRVATSRRMDRAKVAEAAEGRVWSGKRGVELGLVDRIGGLGDALRAARERASLGEDAPVDVWPRRQTLVDSIARVLGASTPDDEAAAGAEAAGGWLDAIGLHPLAAVGAALRRVPGVGASLARVLALAPLLDGRERVVVASPVVLDVR